MNESESIPANADRLPVDSDLESDESPAGAPRAVHLQWRYLGIVAIGGTIGTAVREGLVLAYPAKGFPTTVFLINLVGAFALGLLLELLSRRGADEGRRRTVRLFVGTGVLGGFTTYSALATSSAQLLEGQWGIGVAYALLTIIVGYGASWAGIILGAFVHRSSGRTTAGPASGSSTSAGKRS